MKPFSVDFYNKILLKLNINIINNIRKKNANDIQRKNIREIFVFFSKMIFTQ